MASLGIGPVPRMDPGGGRYSSSKPRRRAAEPQKTPVSTPSYEIEKGAPIGAKKWLKSLFQADAIHLSSDRIAALLGRGRKEEEAGKAETEPGKVSCGPTCRIYREAVELEERDAVSHPAEHPVRRRVASLVPLVGLGVAAVFFLTVAILDVVFGTRSLGVLLALILR